MTRTGPGIYLIGRVALAGILCCTPALAANPTPVDGARGGRLVCA